MSAAQTPATESAAPLPTSAGSVEQVRLGNSVVPLVGPWKFQAGDDPAWSQPGFDEVLALIDSARAQAFAAVNTTLIDL